MLVDRTSKLRLGLLLLDEKIERNFCLSHLFGDRSLFGGVDMARPSKTMLSMKLDEKKEQCIFAYIIFADNFIKVLGFTYVTC